MFNNYIKLKATKKSFLIKLFICIAAIETFTVNTYAQENNDVFDSLVSQIPKFKDDTNKIKLLFDIAYKSALTGIKSDKGIKYAEKALELSVRNDWHKLDGRIYNAIGIIYDGIGDYDKAANSYYLAIDNCKKTKDEKKIPDIINNLGDLNYRLSNYEYAQKLLLQANSYYKKNGDNEGQRLNEKNIANVFSKLGNFDEALKHYNIALSLLQSGNVNSFDSLFELAGILNNISDVYYQKENFSEALDYGNEALNVAKAVAIPRVLNICYATVANANAAFKNYDKALRLFDSSLNIAYSIPDSQSIANAMSNIGTTYFNMAKYLLKNRQEIALKSNKNLLDSALNYLNKSVLISRRGGYLYELSGALKSQAELYYYLGDYKQSYENVIKRDSIEETFFDKRKTISAINIQHDYEIGALNETLKITKSSKTIIIIISVLIFFIFSIFLFAVNKNLKEIKLERARLKGERGIYLDLLVKTLPKKIAMRMMNGREKIIADTYTSASIFFADIKGFTSLTSTMGSHETVQMLNEIFSVFDELVAKHKLEKIKTIGDAYMAAGMSDNLPHHAAAIAEMALEVLDRFKSHELPNGQLIQFRIGVHCGPITAGVIGQDKFSFDVWGTTVNFASRLESKAVANTIHCSEEFKEALKGGRFQFIPCEPDEYKGFEKKGKIQTYILINK